MDTEIIDLTKRRSRSRTKAAIKSRFTRDQQIALDNAIGLRLLTPEQLARYKHYCQTLVLIEPYCRVA